MAESYELEAIVPYRFELRPAPPESVYASATPARTMSEVPVSVLRSHRAPEPPAADVSFRRWLFAPLGECLTRLQDWGAGAPARRIGRSRVILEPPLPSGSGCCLLTVFLHRPVRRRVPMELTIEQSSAPFGTQLTLRPVAEIRTGRRYFREGNAVLSCVEDVLEDNSR